MRHHLDELALSLRIRPADGTTSNHFVRLSPQTAQTLFSMALDQCSKENPDALRQMDQDRRSSDWWIDREESSSNRCTSGIEFLPLAITFANGETIYASYNGGDLDTANKPLISAGDKESFSGLIDIPASFVENISSPPEYKTCKQNVVYVRALSHIASALELFVEPITTEDWDLLQLDAAALEDGRFLQQISVVHIDQRLDLWLTSGTKVSVKVLAKNFEDSRDTVWPKDSTDCCSAQCHSCLRIGADTKIVVKPKPRKAAQTEYPLRVIPTLKDFSLTDPAALKLTQLLNVNLVSVTERVILVHPTTLHRLRDCDAMDEDPCSLIAYVQASVTPSIADSEGKNLSKPSAVIVAVSADVPEDCVAIHPLVRLGLKVPFSSRSSFVIVKQIVSPLEAAKCSRKVVDNMCSGRANLSLIPVSVNFESLQYSSFRCSPFTNREDRLVANVKEHLSTIPTGSMARHLTSDYLVNNGDIMFVPGDDCLYRLDLTWNVEENGPPCPIAESFLFYERLLEVISHSLESCNRHCGIHNVPKLCMKDSVFPGTISRLLPAESVFPSNLHDIVQPAVEFSNTFIYGDRGLGKTHLALTIAAAARVTDGFNVVYVSCRQLRDSFTIRMKAVLTELSKAFDDALEAAPCSLILDDLDELTPSFDSYGPSGGSAQLHEVNSTEIEQSKLIADFLLCRIMSAKGQIVLLATSKTAESLSQQFLLDGNFSHRIGVPTLDDFEREAIYRFFLRRLHPTMENNSHGSFDIARKTRGFRPRDLEYLAYQVYKLRQSEPHDLSIKEATSIVLRNFVTLSRLSSNSDMRDVAPNLKWCHLGGMGRVKSELVSTIVRPSLYRQIYNRAKIRLPRGVLLFGFPGTGKSICVPALARECGFPLILCRGPEILDKYIGASEAKVRELFAQAAACAPSILFFDELDSLAPRRGSDSSGVTDRVVNQLLTFLDGVDLSTSATPSPVYVIAATSRPDKVDPALLRPGRLEKHIYFGLTEEVDDVNDLLEKMSDQFSLDAAAKSAIVSGELTRTVSAANPDIFRRFTAADFNAAFFTAQLMAARTALALGRTTDAACISYDNLVDAMMSARPSLSMGDYQFLSDVYSAFRLDVVPSPTLNRRVESLNTALK